VEARRFVGRGVGNGVDGEGRGVAVNGEVENEEEKELVIGEATNGEASNGETSTGDSDESVVTSEPSSGSDDTTTTTPDTADPLQPQERGLSAEIEDGMLYLDSPATTERIRNACVDPIVQRARVKQGEGDKPFFISI
ncbi:hypothetical protein V502_06295, partial [Pseudogymnoascus sp. VKM F-4520 (FW-2644)]